MNHILGHYHKSHLKHLQDAYDNQLKNEIDHEKEGVDCDGIPEHYRDVHFYGQYDPKENNDDLSDTIMEGDVNFIELCRMLANVHGFTWFDYQEMLIDVFVQCALANIYWDEWDLKKNIILEKHGLDDTDSIVMSETARREGKTTFMVAFALILAIIVTPRKSYPFLQGFVSIGLDASKRMIFDAINLLPNLVFDRERIIVKKTKLWIEVYHYDEYGCLLGINKITAYQTGKVSIKKKSFVCS